MVATLDVLRAEVNGLPVVATRTPWAHATVGMLHVHNGYATDPLGLEGVAHLTEHVCVASIARSHDVRIFAKTDSTSTRYLLRVAPDHLPNLAGAVSAMFAPVAHDQRLHDNETNAVIIEMARLADQPQLSVSPAVATSGYPGLDVSLPDTATTESVRALTPADVLAFRRATYHPNRAVLCLVGPNDPRELLDLLAAEMDVREAPVGPAGSASGLAPGDLPTRDWPARDLGGSCALVLGALTAPARSSADLAARHIASELFAGTPGMLDDLAGRLGARSSAFSILVGREHNLLVVGWPPGPAVDDLAAEVAAAIADPDAHRPDADTVAGVRARVVSRVAFDLQSSEGLAQMLLRHATGTGPWPATDTFETLPDTAVADAAVHLLRSARLWRIADGALAEVEAGR